MIDPLALHSLVTLAAWLTGLECFSMNYSGHHLINLVRSRYRSDHR